MTWRGPVEADAVETAVEEYYGKRIGSLRMLLAGVPAGLARELEPQLGRLESERRSRRAGARLPDEVVLDLYLGTFDPERPERPEGDLPPSDDSAAENERRARLLLRRELEALGYGLAPDPRALPAAGRASRRPAVPNLPTGSRLCVDLHRAEQYVLDQYGHAVRAALTAARIEPIEEAQQYLYFPFASRVPAPRGHDDHGVELHWADGRKGWVHGPLDLWSGANWERHEPLPVPPFAHPEDIVAVVRQLLGGDRDIAPRTREWEHAEALPMLWEQSEALERAYRERDTRATVAGCGP
ncbi:hypothetical protein ACFV1L_19535 [Kitasatospora sp. NPDC059646]|uniref:hypothetical protein n=1 Tax=Kitasatospora sp. NPDC059646 TaxID=3346893 RepID=UPI003690D6C3